MELKHNDATPQRPQGTRPLDAPVIPIDLKHYIAQLQEEEAYHKNRKNAITVFKSETVTITLIVLDENEIIQPGTQDPQPAIMSLQVLDGEIEFQNVGSPITLTTNQLITLHQILSFKATALRKSICLLTMIR
ncbi:MAG: hypothetical protein REI78_02500 [Pedobacter sp.]|nr:hypothetical protein [Pedobacter sp.]MDQ8051863.1 hypothetical protein [Pedobacter sp.]